MARPIGRLERFARWCRRKPVVASLLALLVLTAVIGFAGITWKWIEADRNFVQSEKRRREAERNLAIAIQTNESFADLAVALKFLAGTQVTTVKGILSRVETNYDKLLAETGESPLLMERHAEMLTSFVDVYLALNDSTQARARADRATQLWRRLVSSDQQNLTYRHGLVRALGWLGHTERLQGRSGAAVNVHEEALAICARWPETEQSPAQREEHALACMRLADALWNQDRRLDAEKHYRKALQIRQALFDQGPSTHVTRFRLAQSVLKNAELAAWAYDYPTSFALLKKARDVLDELVGKEPDNTEVREALWDLHRALGRIHGEAGDAAEAERAFQHAVQIGVDMCEQDKGNVRWQRKTMLTRLDRANLLPDPERLHEADRMLHLLRDRLSTLEEEHGLLQILVRRDQSNVEAGIDLAAREQELGRTYAVLSTLGDRPAENMATACRWFDEALKRYRQLAQVDSERPVLITALADVRIDLACRLWMQGDYEEAAKSHLAALAEKRHAYEQFLLKSPSETRLRRHLASACQQIGQKHVELARKGKSPEENTLSALESLRAAADHYQGLAKQEPENVEYLDGWRTAHVTAAFLLRRQGREPEVQAELQAIDAVDKLLQNARAKARARSEVVKLPVTTLSQTVIDLWHHHEQVWMARDLLQVDETTYLKTQSTKDADRLISQYWRLAETVQQIPASAYRVESRQALQRGLDRLNEFRKSGVAIPGLSRRISQFEDALRQVEKSIGPETGTKNRP